MTIKEVSFVLLNYLHMKIFYCTINKFNNPLHMEEMYHSMEFCLVLFCYDSNLRKPGGQLLDLEIIHQYEKIEMYISGYIFITIISIIKVYIDLFYIHMDKILLIPKN